MRPRDTAFPKIRARIEGTALAAKTLPDLSHHRPSEGRPNSLMTINAKINLSMSLLSRSARGR